MKTMRVTLICAMAALTAACAPQTKYAWGGYESSLYDHYKTPADNAVFVQHLAEVIGKAEASGQRVPPGVYAEYGNALLEAGDGKQAIVFFEKEKTNWPGSSSRPR